MSVPQSLTEILKVVTTSASRNDEVGAFAKRVLGLLEGAVRDVQEQQVGVRPAARRNGGGTIAYVVEGDGPNETLAERRLSGKSYPFRCPKQLYDALVAVLGSADRALSTDEIAGALEKRLGERPADFQLRVPLRLWMHSEPPLVARSRARYRAVSQSFETAATELWGRLKVG